MIKINCDLCGRETESLGKSLIENVELDVCAECSKFGKIIQQPKRLSAKEQGKKFDKLQKEEKIELLVEDYAVIIKRKRETMGLTQKDFASKISEKEATVHKIETGTFNPSISLARKLEKALGVRLIQQYEESNEPFKGKRAEGFTLGDFIKMNKK